MLIRNVLNRRWISSREIAKLLISKYPNQDPRSVREAKVKSFIINPLLPKISESDIDEIPISEIHQKWKLLYEARLHDTAFEEAADPGEQCDGELNSWRNDRLKAEKDKNFKAPSVSAHEAATLLKRSKKPL
jgi:Fe-S-cluster formation regulator IscX/YfhJ